MDVEQALSQAELYIRQNLTSQARTILGEILSGNPENEEAWILSAQASDKPEQVLYCLHQAIRINPSSSRARLLLDRLQLPQSPAQSSADSASAPLPEQGTETRMEPHLADAMADVVMHVRFESKYSGMNSNAADTPAKVPGAANGPVARLAAQVTNSRRPMRWLQRVFTILGTACLWAPWIVIQNTDSTTRTLSGVQILLETTRSVTDLVLVTTGLASLASLVLMLLIFFRFRTGAAQKWGERATIALAPLAALLSLELISFYCAHLTGSMELSWGIWASCCFYSLAGMRALVIARRLDHISRPELSSIRAGRTFIWLFSIGDILAILVIAVGLMLGRYNTMEISFGLAIPGIWLLLGALLSHIA
jgi:hypothetical protein